MFAYNLLKRVVFMQLDKLPKRNGFIVSKVWLCFFSCLFVFYSYSVQAAISTVASEQSGTTVNIINHVGAGTFASRSNCGSINPSIPAGSVDDLLIAVALVREQNATVTMDANWTLAYTENFGTGGNETEAYIFYRIATNDALDTNTMTSAGAGNCRSLIGQVSRFDGVDTASPFENAITVGVNSSAQNTATVVTGTETTISATAMSIAVTFISDNATVTEADGFSESFDSTSTVSRDSAISLNYRQESTAGAKGAFTWTQNLGVDENIAVLFALTPDGTNEGISINVPAGTTTDDVMLAAISVSPSSMTIVAPAGWTLINRVDQAAGTSNSQAVYQRVATASEPAAYTWGFSGGAITGTAGGVITYRGVDTVTPIDAFGGNTTVSGTSHTANSINTTVDNTMIVSTHSFSSSETWTPPVAPAGMTEQVDVASLATPNASGISLAMNDVLQAATGATGNITATAAGNADTGVAQIIALTPLLITGNITVTFAGGPIQRILAGSISITDAAIGPPEDAGTSVNVGDSASISTTIGNPPGSTNLTTNALLVDIVGKPRGNHTYSQPGSQTERWDNELGNNNNGAAGAMSTKQVSAVSETMTQTHTSGTRRNAHAVASIAPFDSSSTATFDAVASSTANNSSSIGWTHSLTTSSLINTKVVVGVTYRMTAACGGASISGITYGSLSMTQIAATSVSDGTRCQYSELWYVDLTSIIVSTDNTSSLGGQTSQRDEAVEYDGSTDTGTLFFDDATFGGQNPRLDALHQYDNGNIAMSVANDGITIGTNTIPNGSIALLASTGTAGVYNFSSIIFDESNFSSGNETIDAVYARDNGNIVLSTNNNANLTDVGTFDDDDIIEWDPSANSGAGGATLVFDIASIAGAANNWDVDGVHFLNDDPMLILFSLYSDRTIGPTTYENGDVLLYNRYTSTLSIYFSEDNFSANEDVDALTLAIGDIDPPVLKNFVITASTTASTCTSTEITIEAINTDGALFDYDGTITLNTTTGNGDWDEVDHDSNLSATNPATNTVTDLTADDGQATYLFAGVADGGRVGLFLSNERAETLQVTVSDLTVPGTATSTNITFSDNVFEITPTTCTGTSCPGSNNVYEVVAGRDHVFQVDMVRNDGTSCGVANGYDEMAQTLEVWIVRDGDDPTGTLPSLAEETAALGDGANPGTDNVTLDFSAAPGGTATLTLQTTDVGKFELFLRDTTNNFADVDIDGSTGASTPITVRPFGLGFVNVTGLVANPAASTPGGTLFATAGSDFSAFVGGYTYDATDDADSDGVADDVNNDFTDGTSVLTPSYAWDTDVIAAAMTNIPTDAQGGILGSLTFSTPNGGSGLIGQLDFSGGEEQVIDFAYFEVGSFRMQADATDFLNSTGVSINGTSEIVGRFGADQFTFTANTPALDAACGTFTYVDQPFNYTTAPEITARATAADGTTVLNNYSDFIGSGGENWWLLDFELVADGGGITMTYTDLASPADISLDSSTATHNPNTGITGSSGIQLFNLGGSFAYAKDMPPISEQIPFDGSFRLDFTVTDSDGATGTYTINPISFTNPQQRWGRMVLGNGFGSELLAIEVPLSVEYYNTDGFEINTADTCTTYDSADMSFNNLDGLVLGDLSITGSGTMVNGQDDPANSILATSSNKVGSADVTIDLTSQDWLQFDWDNDTNYDNDPTARITWGIFSGPNEFIYIREPW